ncbi:polyhydroxybutyrate depolymerase [Mucilaginibacter sp. UYNi724]
MNCILLSLCLFFNNPNKYNGDQKRESMDVNGIERAYVRYIPQTAKKEIIKMPLVISLHGGFATPKGQFHLADFRRLADKDKFIVVCPASKHIWHEGRNNKGIDDVKFIDQLITYMVKTYHADPQRVYVTGISNGGFMTSRLACQLSNRIAAIAVVAGSMNENEGYAPVKPMPVIYMHGTKDPVFSNKGGKFFGRLTYSQDRVIKLWATIDKCSSTPVVSSLPDTANDGTSIVKEEYSNPNNGVKVVGYTINNGGHTWPGGWQYLPRFIVGKTTKNLDACQVIWDFFKQYKLN